MTDAFIVIDDESQIKRVAEAGITSVSLHFLDARSKQDQKKALALKSHWAARMNPFAIVMDGDKALKGFYSEADKDVIGSLINYLKNA